MSINRLFGLNLRILSFDLSPNLIKYSDDIRVSITTIPEENKQHFTISARKMKDCHLTFGVNVNIPQEEIPKEYVTTATEKIIVVFRRKSFFDNDPIIASTVIHAKDLPKNLSQQAETKTINIFEKVHKEESSRKENYYGFCELQNEPNKMENRRVVGRMQIQMSLTDPFHLKEFRDDELYDIDKDYSVNDQEYMDDQFKIGQNYYGFKILKK